MYIISSLLNKFIKKDFYSPGLLFNTSFIFEKVNYLVIIGHNKINL